MAGYTVDIDRDRLERASRFTPCEQPGWSDREYTGRINEYWLPPL